MKDFCSSLFEFCCHQQPARTPAFEGLIFPLCYRCAGIFIGIFCSYCILFLQKFPATGFTKKNLPFVLVFMLPIAFDGSANSFMLWQSPGWLRSVTGLLTGILLPFLLNFIVHSNQLRNGVPVGRKTTTYIFCSLAIGLLLVFLLYLPISVKVFSALAYTCAGAFFFFVTHLFIANPWFRLPAAKFSGRSRCFKFISGKPLLL